MLKYVLRRLGSVIPALVGLSVVLFAFTHLVPGNPAATILGERATPQLEAQLDQQLGLNKPIYVQYGQYVVGLLHGDFGRSVLDNQSVLNGFVQRFPNTVELALASLIFAVGLGIPLGRFAGRHARTWRDGTFTVAALLGVSIPVFVLGYILQYIFAVKLGWLPTGGTLSAQTALEIPTVTHFTLIDTLLAGNLSAFGDAVQHLVLPAITLGSIPLAIIARITRASVIEVASEDHVRTARAKGLTERRVERRHITRNAWLPVTTVIGIQVGGLLAGAVITETVFSWDGVGSWAVNAVQNHDYLVVQGTILLFALIFLLVNLVVDVLYAYIDPRIRYA